MRHQCSLTLAALIVGIAAGTLRADEGDPPPILREVKLEQKLNAQVPLDLEFCDENGRSVKLADCADGKTIVFVMAYFRCPQLCTQVLNDLAKGLREVPWKLGEEFHVITVSFDDRETPEMAADKKKNYLEHYGLPGMEKGWHFLTGRQVPILRLANAVGFQFRYDPKFDQFAHPSCVIMLTPEGRVSRYLLGLGYRPLDLRLGLVEASEGRIGTKVADRVMLYCYRYDPSSGRYTAAAMNLVRAAGVVTVLVLGSLLMLAWRRERRKASAVNP